MNVTLPSGKVIADVPEGTSSKDLIDKLARSGGYEDDVREMQASTIVRPIGREGFAAAAKDVAENTAPAGIKALQPVANFAQGVGETFDRYAYGLEGLFGELSPEKKARLAQNKVLAEAGGAPAMAGQVAGDIAITAPAFAAGGALAAPLNFAKSALPRTLMGLGGAVGGGAAAGALSSPEDRAGGATMGGIGGGLGYGAGRVLQKTLGGALPASAPARELMDEGVAVPVWKAGDPETFTGGTVNRVGELVRRFPVAGRALRSQEARALQGWNANLIEAATPPRPIMNEGGQVLRWEAQPLREVTDESLNKLANRFDEAYGAIYGKRRVPVDDAFVNELQQHLGAAQRYTPHLAPQVQGTVNRITDTLRAGTEVTSTTSKLVDAAGREITTKTPGHAAVSAEAMKTALSQADDAVTKAYRAGDGELAEVLEGFRDSLRDLRQRALPPEAQTGLAETNAAYTRFLQLQRAHSMMGAQRSGMVTPRQILSAQRAGDRTKGKAAFARGNVPGQSEALGAERVLGNELPDVGPGTADVLGLLAYGASPAMGFADLGATALLGTRPGQRLLLGDLPGQAAARSATAKRIASSVGPATGVGITERQRAERERQEQLRRALIGAQR